MNWGRKIVVCFLFVCFGLPLGAMEFVRVPAGVLPGSPSGTAVQSFYIGKHEVTWREWKEVRTFGASLGYDLSNRGNGSADDHPVRDICWYDAVKWCNAKSEMDGLQPVYKVNGLPYRSGEFGRTPFAFNAIAWDSSANGYRLPTQVEWEWAARGGPAGRGFRFSGSDSANEVSWNQSNSAGATPAIILELGTHPVGRKKANELGIFDMSGNVWELCWDYDDDSTRVSRGGSWMNSETDSEITGYDPSVPDFRAWNCGLRVASSSEPPDNGTTPTPTPSPSPKPPDFSELAGTYIGNFGAADLDEPAEALLRNGQVLITLKANRQFTGALVFNGRKAGFRGRFDADGNWSGTVTVARRLVEMELFLEAGELGNRVSCIVVFNGEESTAFVLLPAAHTGAKGDVFGWNGSKLNVLFQSTGMSGKTFGHGFAGATSAKDGVMRFAGRLADDTAWSGAARVVRDETGGLRLPLAVPLNSTKGLLHGKGALDSAADVQSGEAEFFSVGTWTWVRGANARARAHKTGFVEGLQPFGQRWSYQRGKNLWTGEAAEMPVRMSLGFPGTVSEEDVSFSTSWPLSNRPVWIPVAPPGMLIRLAASPSLTVAATRGEIAGRTSVGSGAIGSVRFSYRGLLLSPGVSRGGSLLLGGGFVAGEESTGMLELNNISN